MYFASLVIPNTKLLGNMMKIFVLTGPRYDNCPTALRVEVGLIETVWTSRPQPSPFPSPVFPSDSGVDNRISKQPARAEC